MLWNALAIHASELKTGALRFDWKWKKAKKIDHPKKMKKLEY